MLTSETFDSTGITIYQPTKGHRYGEESIALAEFVDGIEGKRVCELGSGVGVISLQIAAGRKPASVTAVEIQGPLHDIALKNARENGLVDVVDCINGDIRDFARGREGAFDIVVSNPPFYTAGEGRLSPDTQRAAARHELNGTIEDFAHAAHELLADDGRFFVVFDARRKDELAKATHQYGFDKVRTEEPAGEAYMLGEYVKK